MILVRHALPEIVPGVPPDRWRLGDEGRAAARALAQRIGPVEEVVTSDEPKAVETAQQLGGTIRLDPRLREAARPVVPDGETYRALARRYVGGERLEGWEPQADVVARFTATGAGAEVVVTHGLAMTLYLGADVRFWEELRFPDAWSALAGHLRRVH